MLYAERVQLAVRNDPWQRFRVSLKGTTTEHKLERLMNYWDSRHADMERRMEYECTVCIRVDNYLKALCRGGQLHPGTSLEKALKDNWDIKIRR